MRQFDPIYFTPPSGPVNRPRTLYKGGGGDGGAAQRKKEEDERIEAAVTRLNQTFGLTKATPKAIDKSDYTKTVTSSGADPYGTGTPSNASMYPWIYGNTQQTTVFDEAGYNSAVKAAQAEANDLNKKAKARETLYTKIGKDFTNNALTDLNKDYDAAAREQRFTLARAGLSGGSRDIDSNRELTDLHKQGILRATNMGTQATNNARSNDDKVRSDLIQSIYAGLSGDSAVQQAAERMSNNAKSAADDASLASMTGFFDAIKQQQMQAAYAQGYNQYGQVLSPQSRTSTTQRGDNGKLGSY